MFSILVAHPLLFIYFVFQLGGLTWLTLEVIATNRRIKPPRDGKPTTLAGETTDQGADGKCKQPARPFNTAHPE